MTPLEFYTPSMPPPPDPTLAGEQLARAAELVAMARADILDRERPRYQLAAWFGPMADLAAAGYVPARDTISYIHAEMADADPAGDADALFDAVMRAMEHADPGVPEPPMLPPKDPQFEKRVLRAQRDLLVRQEAKRRDREAREGTPDPLRVYSQAEAEAGAVPPAPPFRVDKLVPPNAFTTIVAQNKTGKTTLGLNLAYALVTGEDFLGRFGVRELDGNVLFLNYELDPSTFHTWAAERGLPGDRFHVAHLRGRGNLLGRDWDELGPLLPKREVEALIVDPFGRASVGVDPWSEDGVRGWLVDLDARARAAGVHDVLLAVHTGWDGTRSRGSSALEDHPDSKIYLEKFTDPAGHLVRTLRAEGRDVAVDKGVLLKPEESRVITFLPKLSEVERVAVKDFQLADQRSGWAAEKTAAITALLAEHGSLSKAKIREHVGGKLASVNALVDQLVDEGELQVTETGFALSDLL